MFEGSAHSEILFFRVHTFVRERKMGERKRIVWVGGAWRVGLRLERRRGKRRKSSIQWPVSSREDTYVMLDLNATERERKRRSKEGRRRVQREGEKRGSREVAVEQWNGRNVTVSPIPPSVSSRMFCLVPCFLLASPSACLSRVIF